MFTWVKGNVYTLVLTLYPNNITLNSSAASYFEDVRWAMIGLEKDMQESATKCSLRRFPV